MNIANLKKIFTEASMTLVERSPYYSELDSLTGDGDHGVTIAKIGKAIMCAAEKDYVSEKEFFLCIFDALMDINGGSVIPLWAMMSDGVAGAITDGEETSGRVVAKMLRSAVNGYGEISRAKKGDKTLIDPLSAAAEAAESEQNENWRKVLADASAAALTAAEYTRNLPAKYGRAKNLPEKGVGFLDPGAVSFSEFLKAIADAAQEV